MITIDIAAGARIVFVLAFTLFAVASCYSEDDVGQLRGSSFGEEIVPAECTDDGHCVWTIELLDDIERDRQPTSRR